MATTKATLLGHRSATSFSDLTLSGDLTVNGTTTTLDTAVQNVDKLEIGASSTDYGAKINQASTGNILQLQDGGTDVMVVKDGGDIGIGTSSPDLMGVNSNKALTLSAGTSGNVSPYLEIQGSRTSNNARFGGIMGFHQGNRVAGMVFNRADNDAHGQIAFETEGGSGATVKMTIDEDGKIGIGTTSPSNLLHLNNDNLTNIDVPLLLRNAGSGSTLANSFTAIKFQVGDANAGPSESGYIGAGQVGESSSWSGDSRMMFWVGNSAPTVSNPKMTIDGSGNVAIGTDPTNADVGARNLVVGTGSGSEGMTIYTGSTDSGHIYFSKGTSGADRYRGQINYNHNTDYMSFYSAGSERMRINTSGHVGIGVTDPGQNTLYVKDTNSHGYIYLDNSSTSNAVWMVFNQGTSTGRGWLLGMEGNQDRLYIYDLNDSSYSMYVVAGQESWTANSDERLKKDIVPMENRLDDLLNIQVRRYKWERNDKDSHGFIAQELVNYAPEAVDVGNDELVTEEDAKNSKTLKEGELKNPWGVSKESLIPMMIKSIQELSAKVTTLENATN